MQRILWPQITDFMKVLHAHYEVMSTFEKLVDKSKAMPKEFAEPLFIAPMCEIYNMLSKTLKESNILTADAIEEQQKIAKMVDSMVKVQNELVKQSKNSHVK